MSLPLKIINPDYASPLTDMLMELEYLRKLELKGTTAHCIFIQVQQIFHLIESVSSARIEGNRTTIAEYIGQKIAQQEHPSEQSREISQVEEAMRYIEIYMEEGKEITHQFVRELHQIVVDGLTNEGDQTPGAYRTWNVAIKGSAHTPVAHYETQSLMDELLFFVNQEKSPKYDLLRIAIFHHRFVWVHPFGNGNGRVVRLLTYALFIKYGFNVEKGIILNPTAIFCWDRDRYYEMLSRADEGTDEAILDWCDYALQGTLTEIKKVIELLDFDYLHKNILAKTVALGKERGYFSADVATILSFAIQEQQFKAKDLHKVLPKVTSRQRTELIRKMKEEKLISPMKKGSRTYTVNFVNSVLAHSLIVVLMKAGYIPAE